MGLFSFVSFEVNLPREGFILISERKTHELRNFLGKEKFHFHEKMMATVFNEKLVRRLTIYAEHCIASMLGDSTVDKELHVFVLAEVLIQTNLKMLYSFERERFSQTFLEWQKMGLGFSENGLD